MSPATQSSRQTQRIYEAIQHYRFQNPQLRHFALIDGATYTTLGNRLAQAKDVHQWQWLLEGTELDGLKQAGPALVAFEDSDAQGSPLLEWLIQRDIASPLLSWLWSMQPFEPLAEHLRKHLFTRLPDGRRALLRYYDPKVRRALDSVLSKDQHAELMGPIAYWQIWQPLRNEYLTFVPPQTAEVADA
ncbi:MULTISPECIES: DUF4123 domain-containing protein [Pseudomonas]|uniref:DUF4123 domain-containing protein n=1 Tax=Pseudomonadaceae TaxID=135621 RepID=UPI0009F5EEB9|nr:MULTISPECIES: DUF4123 domain-containing protein [Pseudomonas]